MRGCYLRVGALVGVFVAGGVFGFGPGVLAAQCTLTCPAALNLALAGPLAGCTSEVSPAVLGVGRSGCGDPLDVDLFDTRGLRLPGTTDPTGARRGLLPSTAIGTRVRARVTHRASGQNCTVSLDIQDNAAPLVSARDTALWATLPTEPRLSGGSLPNADVSDCSAWSLNYVDSVAHFACGVGAGTPRVVRQVYRRWIAVDAYGSRSTAQQRIAIHRVEGASLRAPADTTLDCARSPNTSLAYGLPVSPATGGLPQAQLPTLDGTLDELYWTHSDERFGGGSGSIQVLRTWRIYDACAPVAPGVNPRNITQRISVRDLSPPSLEVPADTLSVDAGGFECVGSVDLAAASVRDDCDPSPTVVVRLGGQVRQTNGGRFDRLSLGLHEALYTARDASGNTAVARRLVRVRDRTPPALVVQPVRTFAVPGASGVSISAAGYDIGSHDDCGSVTLSIRRAGVGAFAAAIPASCQDVGRDLSLEVAAEDDFGNRIVTTVVARVRDNLAPQVQAPPAVTVTCDRLADNLAAYGQAVATDNCGVTVRDSVVDARDACGVGTITRFWLATDVAGLRSSTRQVITSTGGSGFGESHITWPRDTVVGCLATGQDTSQLPLPWRRPRFSLRACARPTYSYTDRLLPLAGACVVINRTWTVVESCTYAGGSRGIFTRTQRIRVVDQTAPSLAGIPDSLVVVISPGGTCTAPLPDASAWRASDCGLALPLGLRLRELRAGMSKTFTVVGPTEVLSPGRYELEVSARDACGNLARDTVLLRVLDRQPPVARCRATATIAYVSVGAPVDVGLLDLGSADACGGGLTLSTDARMPPCADLRAPYIATLTVADAAGNAATCSTAVSWDDAARMCAPNEVKLAGEMRTRAGRSLPTRFTVTGATTGAAYAGFATRPDGSFNHQASSGEDLRVVPFSDHQVAEGVTSFDLYLIGRHILGLSPLPVGAPRWAADANRTGSITGYDITLLRRIVLELDAALPGGHSYRLVALDAAGVPRANGSGEVVLARSFAIQEPQWLAVKIGDVSAALRATGGGVSSRGDTGVQPAKFSVREGPSGDIALVAEEGMHVWAGSLVLPSTRVRLSPKLATMALVHEGAGITRVSLLEPRDGVALSPGDTLVRFDVWGTAASEPLAGVGQLVVGATPEVATEVGIALEDRRDTRAFEGELVSTVRATPNPVRAGGAIRVGVRARETGPVRVPSAILRLELVDASGRRRGVGLGELGQEIPLGGGLASGVYTLVVYFVDGSTSAQRLVVTP